MAIESVKIPSNIQVEEQIIGPLSLRQIIILLITGGVSYGIWSALKASIPNVSFVFQMVCWTPMMLGLAFSFVSINGVSLLTLLLLMIEGFEKPPIRTFGPRQGININITTQKQPIAEAVQKNPADSPDLAMLSTLLDHAPHLEDENPTATQKSTLNPIQSSADALTLELQDEVDDELDTDFTPMRDIFPSNS
jgi:hypothetical protein